MKMQVDEVSSPCTHTMWSALSDLQKKCYINEIHYYNYSEINLFVPCVFNVNYFYHVLWVWMFIYYHLMRCRAKEYFPMNKWVTSQWSVFLSLVKRNRHAPLYWPQFILIFIPKLCFLALCCRGCVAGLLLNKAWESNYSVLPCESSSGRL